MNIAALTMLVWAPLALATEGNSQLGIVWGFSVPDSDNTQPYRLFGIKGSTIMEKEWSLGGYHFLSDKSGEPPTGEKFRYSLHGAELIYQRPTQKGNTVFSLRIGVTKLRTSVAGVDMVYSPYHYGGAIGYDYDLTTHFSFLFEGSYIHALNGKTKVNDVNYEHSGFNLVNFLLALQLRF